MTTRLLLLVIAATKFGFGADALRLILCEKRIKLLRLGLGTIHCVGGLDTKCRIQPTSSRLNYVRLLCFSHLFPGTSPLWWSFTRQQDRAWDSNPTTTMPIATPPDPSMRTWQNCHYDCNTSTLDNSSRGFK